MNKKNLFCLIAIWGFQIKAVEGITSPIIDTELDKSSTSTKIGSKIPPFDKTQLEKISTEESPILTTQTQTPISTSKTKSIPNSITSKISDILAKFKQSIESAIADLKARLITELNKKESPKVSDIKDHWPKTPEFHEALSNDKIPEYKPVIKKTTPPSEPEQTPSTGSVAPSPDATPQLPSVPSQPSTDSAPLPQGSSLTSPSDSNTPPLTSPTATPSTTKNGPTKPTQEAPEAPTASPITNNPENQPVVETNTQASSKGNDKTTPAQADESSEYF